MRHLPVDLLAKIKPKRAAPLVLLVLLAIPSGALADAIAKSFGSASTIEPGRVVALVKDNPENVELVPAGEVSRIYGVAIDQSDAAVTLQKENQTVFVATSGTYPVIVNATNGVIRVGDYLSVSKTNGVAAKATVNQDYILGKALETFTAADATTNIEDTPVGEVQAEINPGKNPLTKGDPSIPGPLLKLANAVAGKPVSAARIYSALGVLVLALTVAAALILVGVRTSIISIGRNPLSKQSIMHGMFQVIIAASLIFVGGLLGSFLLLRL